MTRPPGDLPGEGGYGSSSEYPSPESTDWFSPRTGGSSSAHGLSASPGPAQPADSAWSQDRYGAGQSGQGYGANGFSGASDPGGQAYGQRSASDNSYYGAPVASGAYDRPFPTGPGDSSSTPSSSSSSNGGGSSDYGYSASGEYGGGGKRKRKKGALIGPLAGAVGLAMLLGVAVWAFEQKAGGCTGTKKTLTVAVAKEIAPAVEKSAKAFTDSGKDFGGVCYAAEIVATDPNSVRTALTGEGVSSGSVERPDVWIPDTSLWTGLVQAADSKLVTPTTTSIATSPVVVAVPKTLAAQLAKENIMENPSWDNLLSAAGGVKGGAVTKNQLIPPELLDMRVPDPVSTGTGMSAISMLRTLLESDESADTIFTGVAQTIRNHTVASNEALFKNFKQDARGRFPLLIAPEYSVYKYNSSSPKEPAVTIYPYEGMVSLDYPVAITTTDSKKAEAGQELAKTLVTPAALKNYEALGFRTPDRKAPAAFSEEIGLSPGRIQKLPLATPEQIYKITQDWSKLSLAIRMLSVIDVSGTMNDPIPGGNGATRMQAILQIASQGLTQFPQDSQIGTWIFADLLQGKQDWKEVVPVAPLNKRFGSVTQLDRLKQGLLGVKAMPANNTGLYDTVLGSYRYMKKTHQPGRINSIVLFTDGLGNDDPHGGITLPQLLKTLKQEVDERKPVQIIMISIGSGKEQLKIMNDITRITGGDAYIPKNAKEIQKIFLKALSKRMCAGEQKTC
ncbi:substrate-binding and VWA domain-containing protein [Actinocorallia sp. A-T 12471]|uniref:substrate-binding and VWA domain-containing protein n=1 Tax=Actinocorallia sp. A-T 12471 TaxID=3089813 RepID=UPI0029D00572|nr:substrate-binding and VWA domain-containing protein [Actinocorallia sp. A-T 12471]MDX6742848.1 substrate-binding and VWA domain-containing protein [Actinocorallia sp. A-T 12471]